MNARLCRLCYGTGSRFEVVPDVPVDGPYLRLVRCPCRVFGVKAVNP